MTKSKKKTGSYYTPKTLSDFLISHIFDHYINGEKLNILEPSCGDGQFINSLFNNIDLKKFNNINLSICDIDEIELKKTISLIPNRSKIKTNPIHGDYLNYFLNNNNKYSLIIGNPPYIRKKNMVDLQISNCESVREKIKTYSQIIKSKNKINNIWTAFVESAIMSLDEKGIICFVIPAEIMHVNYTKELRRLIQTEFDKVEIFAFNELIFEDIQQDVVALIGIKKVENSNLNGVSFYQVENLEDLKEPRFTELHSNIHRLALDKWTNYILTDEDLNFIEDLKTEFHPIKKYCEKAQVGIVSAANDYFILKESDIIENKLNKIKNLVKPILSKGSVIPNMLDFTREDYSKLLVDNEKVCFIQFPDTPKNKLGKIANDYIKKGEEFKENNEGELHKRYKMTKRNNWYHVPCSWYSEGVFVKRSHLFPKIIINSANSLVTDSFYRIETKENYNIRNLAFSFYNTLTFVLAELEGRFYGGGVLELTPNEFKNLIVPYSEEINENQINYLDSMLRNNHPIEEILNYTDSILFEQVDTQRLRNIWLRLVNRRLKR